MCNECRPNPLQNTNQLKYNSDEIPEQKSLQEILKTKSTIEELKKCKACAPTRETIVLIKETLEEECRKLRETSFLHYVR